MTSSRLLCLTVGLPLLLLSAGIAGVAMRRTPPPIASTLHWSATTGAEFHSFPMSEAALATIHWVEGSAEQRAYGLHVRVEPVAAVCIDSAGNRVLP